ncbi:unnamed protein product [Sphenostylis stenocarpa]|uniref:Uncharacterized protein n=1 Tax=Sphenostylis stenocarpa TaxID=92480 RepID=A0AA86VC49_9FABA|nr:unnamed protein product [Sphenostylis stenocarpa]
MTLDCMDRNAANTHCCISVFTELEEPMSRVGTTGSGWNLQENDSSLKGELLVDKKAHSIKENYFDEETQEYNDKKAWKRLIKRSMMLK